MMKRIFLLPALLTSLAVIGQKQVAETEQTWLGYIQQVRLSDKWSLTADLHFRTADNLITGKNLSVGRTGVIYHLSEKAQLTAGYAYFHYYPGESHPADARPEHRPWQQVLWTENHGKLRLQHRIRLEERWRRRIDSRREITEGYNYNWRGRTQVQLLYPLGKKPFVPGSVALMVADELMVNFGKEIVHNTFDQNRLITGVQIQLGKQSFLQAGYMYIFQQQAAAGRYRANHVARIFFTQNLDLRKKSS